MKNIAAFRTDLAASLPNLAVEDNPLLVKQKSRDFYWYSPILKKQLDHVTAELVVTPTTEAEIVEIVRLAYRHDVPVTTRGAGTGNYGQAMPLSGGVVLNLADMSAVKEIGPGYVVAEPGANIKALCEQTRADSGQELRFWPSTAATRRARWR